MRISIESDPIDFHCVAAISSRPSATGGRSPVYFFFVGRLGRWVRADPAAVFAALLAVGFRRTFEAADAARLLVTSRLVVRFAMFLVLFSFVLLYVVIWGFFHKINNGSIIDCYEGHN